MEQLIANIEEALKDHSRWEEVSSKIGVVIKDNNTGVEFGLHVVGAVSYNPYFKFVLMYGGIVIEVNNQYVSDLMKHFNKKRDEKRLVPLMEIYCPKEFK